MISLHNAQAGLCLCCSDTIKMSSHDVAHTTMFRFHIIVIWSRLAVTNPWGKSHNDIFKDVWQATIFEIMNY